eukprot:4424285-Prymnesium_polylepis.1
MESFQFVWCSIVSVFGVALGLAPARVYMSGRGRLLVLPGLWPMMVDAPCRRCNGRYGLCGALRCRGWHE